MPSEKEYLIPFGREPGSFLDVLGLLADATEQEVGSKEREHRNKLSSDARQLGKQLREQQAAGKLTKEELEEQLERVKAEKDKKESDFNELKAAYTAKRAQERGQRRSGTEPVRAGWQDLHRGADADAEGLAKLLGEPRPLPQLQEAWIGAAQRKWIEGREVESSTAGLDLPTARFARTPQSDIATLAELACERDVVPLLWADELWGRLRGTNREHWRPQIAAMAESLARNMPSLRIGAGHDGVSGTPALPELWRPADRTIDKLAAGDEVALAQGPARDRTSVVLTPEQMLELLREADLPDELRARLEEEIVANEEASAART